jgi:hypothetical protein
MKIAYNTQLQCCQEGLGNSLAPNRIFNAILHSPFSAAAELAPLRHPRRPTSSGSLEGRITKAKSSMVATAISQTFSSRIEINYHAFGVAS